MIVYNDEKQFLNILHPITKNANPSKGIVAVSRMVVTRMTPSEIGSSKVYCITKHKICPLNLCFVLDSAVINDTNT